MLQRLRSVVRGRYPNLFLPPQGERGIAAHGHRQYVGGRWDEIGELQLNMLRGQGLRPEHYLLDIACGSFRLGVRAIDYLERGRYLGIEKERRLVELGIEHEIGTTRYADKQPQIIISSDFEFERFTKDPDFAIAQSLFTHLTPELINLCFKKLRPRMKAGSIFLATFFEAEGRARNPTRSNDWGYFAYERQQMLRFGIEHGFSAEYIGDWQHPRGQVLVKFEAARLDEGHIKRQQRTHR